MNVLKTAFMALFKNKMRSFLTALGIIIGVGAVISMVNMGTGASKMVESQISSLGRDVIMIFPGSSHMGGRRGGFGSASTLTSDDADAIKAQVQEVDKVSPIVRSSGQLVYGNTNWSSSVYGVYEDYFGISNIEVTSGRLLHSNDIIGNKKVCVIGTEVAENLFGDEDPVGKNIRINKIPFKIVGLLKKKGQSMMGQSQDDVVYMPFKTAQKRLIGTTYTHYITSSAINSESVDAAKDAITDLLRRRHKITGDKEDDFHIRSSAEIIETSNTIMTALTLLLGSIASVSLLVGGIGIMNIMLVSVVERTREIGIRMAVGARPRDILRQFLIESTVLSVSGGIVGILFGVVITFIIANVADWEPYISIFWTFIAFSFSAFVGIFFGYYPAYKASRMDPIEALRYE
ncbi:MAG: ABC transporter permease [Acidobacteria bacterium]|nr:ABC transporter permease [Acidobacteriota bacterium]